ncbi:uncharacterized protein LOC128396881 [Panonychus citri]|uniref:uncharacterized protein LOC128396881 n=1 Tax=Panonychus citri TaxID=50023 RepID=UPI0023082038|nr:uncharacterized protein LOC128396881 [Panonychus citri]
MSTVTDNLLSSSTNNQLIVPTTTTGSSLVNMRRSSRLSTITLIVTILMTILINLSNSNNYQVEAFYNTNDPEGFDDYILSNLQLAGGGESNLIIDSNNLPFERLSSSSRLSSASSPVGSVITMKRSCIKRSGICDNRPADCCLNSVCRCNLWGANCRCQRMGLFQRLGRK